MSFLYFVTPVSIHVSEERRSWHPGGPGAENYAAQGGAGAEDDGLVDHEGRGDDHPGRSLQ